MYVCLVCEQKKSKKKKRNVITHEKIALKISNWAQKVEVYLLAMSFLRISGWKT